MPHTVPDSSRIKRSSIKTGSSEPSRLRNVRSNGESGIVPAILAANASFEIFSTTNSQAYRPTISSGV